MYCQYLNNMKELYMTINPYFNNQNGVVKEQNLTEDLIIEMIQLSGRNWIYIPRNTVNVDEVLNEAPLSRFEDYKVIEMYVNNYSEFGGNNLLFNSVGLTMTNQLELIVSKKRFKEEVQPVPLAGDLLFEPLSKMIFQIDFANDEPSPNYQLQKVFTYTLKCTPFTHSYEDFNTGVKVVDDDMAGFEDKFDNQDNVVEELVDNEYLNTDEHNPLGFVIPEEE
jgi:hypothetical protein